MPLKDGAPPRKQDLEGCEHRNNPPGKELESIGEKGLKTQTLSHWIVCFQPIQPCWYGGDDNQSLVGRLNLDWVGWQDGRSNSQGEIGDQTAVRHVGAFTWLCHWGSPPSPNWTPAPMRSKPNTHSHTHNSILPHVSSWILSHMIFCFY